METPNSSQSHSNNETLTVSEFLGKSLEENAQQVEGAVNTYFSKYGYYPDTPPNVALTTNVLLWEIYKELKKMNLVLSPHGVKEAAVQVKTPKKETMEEDAADGYRRTSILVRSCFLKKVELKKDILGRLLKLPEQFSYDGLVKLGVIKGIRRYECEFIGEGRDVLVGEPILGKVNDEVSK